MKYSSKLYFPRLSEFYNRIKGELKDLKRDGLFKKEVVLKSAQTTTVKAGERGKIMLNFCANNYLGLSNHPELRKIGREILKQRGAGMSSVRFICGTQDIHKELEKLISSFHGTQDTILYSSCFDANAGLFETILGPEDVVLSDALNHASIIDGIRLCKAQKVKYSHGDMKGLEEQLKKHEKARMRLIATDGVFSMDGELANLPEIVKLAQQYKALIYVDDSHATGFLGPTGRGTAEYYNLTNKIDIIGSTLGKALGGSSGGYITGRKPLIDLLRQRSRPYLFSNSLAPVIVAFAARSFQLINTNSEMRQSLHRNTALFRKLMAERGFSLMGHKDHPICPVLIGDAVKAAEMAKRMRKEGILVIAFSFPVVPKDKARIRVQISAAHTTAQIKRAVDVFEKVANSMNILPK